MRENQPKIDLNQIVLNKIESIREKMKLNQNEFAKLIGLSFSAYSRIKNGQTNLTLNFIQHISEVTHKPINEILEVSSTKVFHNENNKGIHQNGDNPVLNVNLTNEQFESLKKILDEN